jgi:alpha-1,2-mannosyltransferase
MLAMSPDNNDSAAVRFSAVLRCSPDSHKFRLLATVLLLLFAAYALIFGALTVQRLTAGQIGDFFALWSTARLAIERQAAEAYDPAALKSFQLALGMEAEESYPFPYPPSFLLALVPFGMLSHGAAFVVFVVGTLAVYLWATAGCRWRSPVILAALLAPTTTITAAAGQAGFVEAALLIGGFRLAPSQPVVAGILFGLATYKPQMGILVPVALLAAGMWRTICAAAITVAALVVATGIVCGPGLWRVWAAYVIAYAHQFAAESGAIAHLMPTVSAGLAQLGAPPAAMDISQLAAAVVAAVVVWRCFRRGPTALAAAALLVATFLASPHAFVYDMPPVATAVLWTIAERQRAGDTFGTGEIAIMLLAMVSPIALVAGPTEWPVVQLALAMLLAIIAHRCLEKNLPVVLRPLRPEG